MDAGRGQLSRSFKAGLEKNEPIIRDAGARAKHKTRRSSKRRRDAKTVNPAMFSHMTPEAHTSSIVTYTCAIKPTPTTCTQNHILRMPPEILLKILSYLDAFSLLCVEHVNKLFHQLANNKHGWRSLMTRLDTDTISGSKQMIGFDKLVNLVFLPPGLLIGTWRGDSTIAFVMANFHFHRLVERSLLSSPFCLYSMLEDKPHFMDEDPSYDCHSYRLHIVLHNTVTQIMLGCFPHLSCEKGQIHGRYVYLTAIRKNELSQHTPLSGKVRLPWRWGALQGSVENCCMMSLTLLDEAQLPIWCVSTPVSMLLSCGKRMSRNYKGEYFLIRYQELEGKVKMKLVWLEEQQQFFLIGLTVAMALAKVNRHFGSHNTG